MTLHYKVIGQGPEKILITHDWLCDTSSYDPLLPYLDQNAFTFAFVDLRGYGGSKEIAGEYSVAEAAKDLLAVANDLNWDTFHAVGHSMSGLIVQHFLIDAPNRIKTVVAISPPVATEGPIPPEIMAALQQAAKTDDQGACGMMHMMTGGRLSDTFCQYKVRRWRETSTTEARLGYLEMFLKTNFTDKLKGNKTPILIVVGEYDFEGSREPAMRAAFTPLYPNVEFVLNTNAGHYPMQETPAFLSTVVQNFLLSPSKTVSA